MINILKRLMNPVIVYVAMDGDINDLSDSLRRLDDEEFNRVMEDSYELMDEFAEEMMDAPEPKGNGWEQEFFTEEELVEVQKEYYQSLEEDNPEE